MTACRRNTWPGSLPNWSTSICSLYAFAAYTEARGGLPYDPRLMALLLYAYTTGVWSSRMIERRCVDDVAFRWLTAGASPDYRAIAEFRKQHLSALGHLFVRRWR